MMNTSQHMQNQTSIDGADGVPAPLSARSREIATIAAGAAIGSTLGSFGGPIGLLAGAVIGAAVGALSERTARRTNAQADQRNAELDAEIGLTGGDMGAPSLRNPGLTFNGRAMREQDFFGGRDELSRQEEVYEEQERQAA